MFYPGFENMPFHSSLGGRWVKNTFFLYITACKPSVEKYKMNKYNLIRAWGAGNFLHVDKQRFI